MKSKYDANANKIAYHNLYDIIIDLDSVRWEYIQLRIRAQYKIVGLNNQHFDSKRHIWGQNDLEKNLYIAKRRDYKRSGFGELRQRHLPLSKTSRGDRSN